MLWSATGGIAGADSLGADAYRARLRDARALLQTARSATGSERAQLVESARALLRTTTEVQTAAGPLAVDDAALAARITIDSVDREITELDRYIALTDGALAQRVDAAGADLALRQLVSENDIDQRLDLGQIASALVSRFAGWLYNLMGRPDPNVLFDVQAAIGLLVAIAIVVVLVRGTRERIRRETTLDVGPGDRRADPVAQLRAADDALRGGRPREAIHFIYLFALGALDAREALRYDSDLTDHELLRRAAQLPHVGALGDLMQLHERVWFGLREAREADVAQARAFAIEATR